MVLLWGLVDAVRGGEPVTYQLFVGVRLAADPPEFLQGKEREVIGLLPGDDGDLLAYDALVDPDLKHRRSLYLVAPDEHVEIRRPIVPEHSNRLVVFDEAKILKLFRRIEPGNHVVIPASWPPEGRPTSSSPGRAAPGRHRPRRPARVPRGRHRGVVMARTSVRDALAGRIDPAEAGGELAHVDERLGAVLAELRTSTLPLRAATSPAHRRVGRPDGGAARRCRTA